MSALQCRPIDKWPRELTKNRRRSPFRAGYGQTLDLMDRELSRLKARSAVLLMALSEDEIRLDGRPRHNARPLHPGVILVVETPQGTLRFPCDKFDHWADNLRAIGLTLEALRLVNRYDVTSSGEQYKGWQRLTGPGQSSGMPNKTVANDVHVAASYIEKLVTCPAPILEDSRACQNAIVRAERLTHPDRGGYQDDFVRVREAREILLKHHELI